MNALFGFVGGWLVGRGMRQRRAARAARAQQQAGIAQRRAAYLDQQRRRSA